MILYGVKQAWVDSSPDFSAAAVIKGIRSLKGVRSTTEDSGREDGDVEEAEGDEIVDRGEEK